jgi:hypothetical protein
MKTSVADPDPVSGAFWFFLTPGSGSGIRENIPDHISESLETLLGLNYSNSLLRIRIRNGNIWIRDPGSGINIPDPQDDEKTLSSSLLQYPRPSGTGSSQGGFFSRSVYVYTTSCL